MVSKNYYSDISFEQFREIIDPNKTMTQIQIADHLDVSQASISLWKKNNKIPKVFEIIARGRV
jgi:DNA-binding XRE family transcriptional regulator